MSTKRQSRMSRWVGACQRVLGPWAFDAVLTWDDLLDRLPFHGPRHASWKRRPFHPELEPLEKRWMLSGVTEYSITTNATSLSSGPDGNLWFTMGSKIGKMTTSGSATYYSLPNANSVAYDICSDGTSLWFTESTGTSGGGGGGLGPSPDSTDGIGKITTSGTISEWQLSGSNTHGPHGIVYGPDSKVWFCESADGYVDKFDPSLQTFTRYAVPSGSSSAVEDIIVGPDSLLWVSEKGSNKLAKITTSGSFTEYTFPSSNSQPWGVAKGPEGSVWATEYNGNRIAKVSTSGSFTEYSIPTASSQAKGIAAGADGDLWFVESANAANNITTVTPLGTFLEQAIPTASSGGFDVAVGPDNLVWLTESAASKIGGKVQFDASGLNLGSDPGQSLLVPLGLDQAAPGSGNYHAEVPIDYRLSTSASAWGSLPGTDVLAYNSQTADPRPIVQATATTRTTESSSAVTAILTWNYGTPQATVTYGLGAVGLGDTFLLDQQVASAVASTGSYPWKVGVTQHYQDSNLNTIATGTALVVANTGQATGYYGWDVGGHGQLVGTLGGVQWVTGKGGSRFFQQLTSTTFQSPTNDFGTLVKNGDGTFTYTAVDQTKDNFNTSGLLTGLVDPHGLRLTYTYNAASQLSVVQGPDGGLTTFQYDGSNRLTTVLQAGGGTLLLTPTSSNLTGFTDANNRVRVFAYDSAHHLTLDQLNPATTTVTYDATSGLATSADTGSGASQSLAPQATIALSGSVVKSSAAVAVVTDAAGAKTTYTLDGVGRVTQRTGADGSAQTFALNTAGLVTVSTDPLGHVTSYSYDSAGDVTQIQEPDGGIWTFQYDATFHKMTLSIDPRGDRTTYTLDTSTGDVLTIKNALNQVTTQTWSGGLLATVTDPLGHVTTNQYDAGTRRLTDVVDPTGARTTFGYDAAGDRTSVQDARGNLITYAYDGDRRLLQVNYPDGGQVTYAYNSLGQTTSQTDPLGHVTNDDYDLHGWLTTLTEAAGTSIQRVTTTAYDSRGNVLSTTDALGHTTSFGYDSMDRQTVQVGDYGGLAARSTTVYDLAGNTLSVADPLNHITSYAYDLMNRQTRSIEAYGTALARTTTTAYDLAGNVLSSTDPRSMVTCFQYDALNRQATVIADRFDPGGAGLQATSTTAYDAAGRVLSTTDPLSHTTSFGYDAANRRTQVIDAYGTGLARTTTTAYDSVGNVASVVDARGTIGSFSYDALNRRTVSVQAFGQPEQALTTTVYDLAGNALSVTDPTGTVTSYALDALNRRTQRIDSYNNASFKRTTTTVYDAASHVVQTVDPLGFTTTQNYDGLNRLVSTQDANGNLTTRVYDLAGNVLATVDGLGNRTTSTFDALNRVATVLDARGGVVTYLYDSGSNQTTVVDPVGNRTTMTFDYLGRKTQETDPLNHSSTLVYDLAGNLTSRTDRNGNVRNLSYDALNRQTTEVWLQSGVPVNTITYSRDAADNLLTAVNAYGAYTMAYDRLGRMTSEQEPFSAVLTFTYNAAGDRTSIADSFGATTTDTYDPLHRLATIQLGGPSQTPLRVDMTYTPRDQLATLTRYSDLNGTVTVGQSLHAYDPGQRLISLKHVNGAGSTLENYTYTYDSGDRW